MAVRKTGRSGKRQRKLEQAVVRLSVRPGMPAQQMSAWHALGMAENALLRGDYQASVDLCRQLLNTAAAATDARILMLKTALQLHQRREIRWLTNALLEQPPQDAHGIEVLARGLREIDAHDQGIALLDQAIRTYPANAALRVQRGNLLMELGDTAGAEQNIRTALRLEPGNVSLYRPLGWATHLTEQDITHLETAKIPASQQVDVWAALARAYRQRGDVEREFDCLDRANAELRRQLPWSAADDELRLRNLQAVFSPEYFTERRGSAARGSRPIFVISLPRSGSTLIEQMLSSHPSVDAIGETNLFHWVLMALGQQRFPGQPFPDFCAGLNDEDFRNLGMGYCERVSEVFTSAGVFVDKQPQHEAYVGVLAMALPEARFVHLIRGPMDTCLSCYQQVFATVPYSHSLGDLAHRYRHSMSLMDHWKKVLPGRILTVAYEEVIENPETEARRLLDFCGLAWDAAVLGFQDSQRPVRTASVHQVRRGIYSSSVDKWQRYAKYLGPVTDVLGEQADIASGSSVDGS